MKLKKIFIAPNQPKNRLEIDIEFDLPNGKYHHSTLWVEDFIGDTPGELADSLQIWVDHFRMLEEGFGRKNL